MPGFKAKDFQGIAGRATSRKRSMVKHNPNVLDAPARLVAGTIGSAGTVLAGSAYNAAGLTALTSVVGTSAAAVACTSVGAVIVGGAAVAGAVDIAYRVWNCKNTFFQPKSNSELAVGVLTSVSSIFASMYLALKFTVFFLSYGIKAIADCICRNKSDNAEKAIEALPEACRHLAGIIFFPVINLVDCAGSAIGLRSRLKWLFDDSPLENDKASTRLAPL